MKFLKHVFSSDNCESFPFKYKYIFAEKAKPIKKLKKKKKNFKKYNWMLYIVFSWLVLHSEYVFRLISGQKIV